MSQSETAVPQNYICEIRINGSAVWTADLQKLLQQYKEQQIAEVRRQIPDVESREAEVEALMINSLADLMGRKIDHNLKDEVTRRVAALQPEIKRILFNASVIGDG